MAGLIGDEIAMEREGAQLVAFVWQDQRYPIDSVQIVGTPPTRWWDGEGERTFLRVASKGRLFEMFFDHEWKTWILARRL